MHELLCVTFTYVEMWMCIYFLCFMFLVRRERGQCNPPQVGGREQHNPLESEEKMVATGGNQVHLMQQVEIVSKILCIV